MDSVALSIIIPCLNDATDLQQLLTQLQVVRSSAVEIIVVDGGSDDDSEQIAHGLADRVLLTSRGRARQMSAGADKARGKVFWFVHADSSFSPVDLAVTVEKLVRLKHGWGRLIVRLSGQKPTFRVIERFMEWRSRLTGMVTGDQAMFVTRGLFERRGGFPDMPLMEDIAISKTLKRETRPQVLPQTVTTSSRRWESQGVFKTIFLMWRLRLAYFMGTSPEMLVRQYYR
ncbi:MAG: TIGR04283 family arsenosugar biosynthesis glycosyltransferase [bacterium]